MQRWREIKRYNQKGFADLLGISRGSVSNYERHKLPIPDAVWHRFLEEVEGHPSKTNSASDHPTNKAEDPSTYTTETDMATKASPGPQEGLETMQDEAFHHEGNEVTQEDPTAHEDAFVTIHSGSGASVLKSLWRKRVDAFHAFRVERRQRFLFLKKPDISDGLVLAAHLYLVYFVLHVRYDIPLIFPISVTVIFFIISVPIAYIGAAVLFYEQWKFVKQLNAQHNITITKLAEE